MSHTKIISSTTLVMVSLGASGQLLADHEHLPDMTVVSEAIDRNLIQLNTGYRPVLDTADMLKSAPGGNINRNGPLTGLAQYRGMYGDRVDVDVDGFSWKGAGPNSMDPGLSQIPPALVESFEMYRGISPVSSGIETIGGSMKVTSRKGEFAGEDEDYAFHGVAAGKYSMVDNGNYGALLTSIATQHQRLYVLGNTEEGNDYKYENDKAVRSSQYDRDNYTLGYGYQRSGHGFDVSYRDQSVGHTGTPALPMDIVYVRGGVTSFEYNGDFGDGQKLEGSFNYQDMRHKMSNSLLRDVPTNRMTGMDMYRENLAEVDGFEARMAYSRPLFDGRIKVGVDVDQSHHDATITDPTNGMFFVENFNGVKRDRYSIFTEWNGDVAENWNLELGVRYNHIRSRADKVNTSMAMMSGMMGNMASALRDGFNSSDRNIGDDNIDLAAVLNYAWSENLSFEAGVARKTRSPSYQELFLWLPLESTGGLADNRVYIGNTSLNHEVSYQFELGLEWNSEKIYFAPRFFYHHVDDYIQGTPSSNATANMFANMMTGVGALEYTNIDAKLYGFDVDMGYQIIDGLRLDAVVSYVKGRRRDTGDNLYRIAPLNGSAQLTYAGADWSVTMESVFATAQNDVADYNLEDKTPGYALLNLRSHYEPLRGLTIGIGVDNVMDKKYYDHLNGYNRARGNSDLAVDNVNGDRVRLPGEGRNYYATLSYAW